MLCPPFATLVRNHTLWGTVGCYVINSNKPVFIFGFGISYQMDMEIVQLAISWTVDFISEMAPLIKRLILRYFDSRFKGLTLLPSCDNEQINSFGTITTYTSMRFYYDKLTDWITQPVVSLDFPGLILPDLNEHAVSNPREIGRKRRELVPNFSSRGQCCWILSYRVRQKCRSRRNDWMFD